MAGAKEIRTQIASIKNTQKITKAMQMVAASKMRKAQERMMATRPYAAKIQNVVAHLSHAHPEYHHPYLIEREVKRVGLIIISTDRGLCGGLNINLFKTVITAMKEWHASGLEVDLTLIVIQHRKLPASMLVRVKQAVENVGGNLLGVVLNNVDVRSDSQYQYYTSYYTYYAPTEAGGRGKPAAAAGRAVEPVAGDKY